MRSMALAALVSVLAMQADAQEPDSVRAERNRVPAGLDVEAAQDIAALYNQPAAMRVSGRLDIAAAQTVNGNVAVLRGPVSIGGRVTGNVIVVNGDLRSEERRVGKECRSRGWPYD